MTECLDDGVLSAFATGELADAVRARIELHVDACASCRIALSGACRRAAVVDETPALPEVGEFVGRYLIVERIGSGAMGVVFGARDRELDRDLAIKLVQPQVGASDDVLVRERMMREGRALARIDHPNVVRVLDVGEWRGSLYVVMERARGLSLRAWLVQPRSETEVVARFAQCAAGLAAAHAAGVVHRDFKPDNVIVDDAGHARVTDFGLAQTPDSVEAFALGSGDAPDVRLTRTRGAVGTPAYMAPEQHRGGRVDARSDQFALCVALAEALGGTRPFAGTTQRALAEAMASERPKLPRASRRVRAVLRRGLAAEPAHRFADMTELGRSLTARTWWPWLAAAVLVVAGVAVLLVARPGSDRCEVDVSATLARAPAAPYASAAVVRYLEGWRGARGRACRARETQVVRCLDRRRSELEALLARWEASTSPEVIDRLRPVASCDVAELDVVPDDARLDTRFAAARADAAIGRTEIALAALAPLVAELGRRPALRAEVLTELAGVERDLGRIAAAHDHLVSAIAAAETAGAARAKATAWIELAELSADDSIDVSEANDALRLAGAVLERLGEPADLVARHEVGRGIVALRAGDAKTAVAALRAACDEAALRPAEYARRRQILARALIAAGDVEGALAELDRAEHVLVEAFGRDAGPLVFVESSRVEPLDYLGRFDDAIAHGERALTLLDAHYGRDANPRRIAILGNLAAVYANAGQLDRAIELESDVLAASERVHGADAHRTAIALVNLATTLTDAERPAPAIPYLDRALAIFTRTSGPEHPLVANAHGALAAAHGALGHLDLAVDHARRAVAIRERANVGPGHLAYSRFLLADALLAAGARTEAIAAARHALELPLATDGREGALAGEIRAWLAHHTK